ncbi:MAG: cohesin domain-containing protein, partial [Desulfuromonadaceae bacterium]|nr:cohesin domain-containing protein [Desulfuromonadaceae bacterium]
STAADTTTSSPATVNNLVRAFTMKGFGGYVTVPNATYNLGKTLAKGEVLSNPKIRVKNKEKAKFNVGTRVPITTTTLNGTVSQVNVQYVDVGVKVNAEPSIQLNNEISIKLNLEVSSILQKETVGADKSTSVVTIGTRNVETVLSLKDGETSIIGGLIQNSSNNDKSKVYLLSDIPLIGPLFTNSNSSKDKTELMLAITPRLIRGISVPLPGLASFVSGKEDHPSLVRPMSSFDLEPVFEGEAQPKGIGNKNDTPSVTAGISHPVIPGSVPPAPQPVAAQPGPVVPVPVPARRTLLQIAAPLSASVGQQFNLDIKVSEVNDLANAPFVLTYDPALVSFMAINEGTFMKKDGRPTTFGSMTDSAAGTVTVTLGLTAGNSGVSGGGTLATASFKTIKQGLAKFAFGKTAFGNSSGAVMDILPFSTAVDIR